MELDWDETIVLGSLLEDAGVLLDGFSLGTYLMMHYSGDVQILMTWVDLANKSIENSQGELSQTPHLPTSAPLPPPVPAYP